MEESHTQNEIINGNEEEDKDILKAIKKEKDKRIQISLVYLNKLNDDMNYSESNKYHSEYVDIRNKYEEKCFYLYKEMSHIINGTKIPEILEEDYSKYDINASKCSNEDLSKPIENFWLNVLQKSDFFDLTTKDKEMLIHLNDIHLSADEDNKIDITISFHFNKNSYFTNEILTKTYIYNESNEKLYKSIPTTIDWVNDKEPSNKGLNFFLIFDKREQISLDIEENEAYFFKNDLMQNMLNYYLDIEDKKKTLDDLMHLKSNLNYKMKAKK